MKRPVLAAALALVAARETGAAPAQSRRPPEWQAMEAGHATIAEVVVHVQPVFDPGKPEEDTWFGRLANRIHVPTREGVVRRALLFKPGSRLLAREVYESERILRALPFIKDAHIQLERLPGNQARAQVWVRDSWTLQADASFKQVGGQGSTTFGIQDQNVLGTGKTLGFSIAKDHERTDSQVSYRDPQLFGSRWVLDADCSVLTDGYARRLSLRRPFYALQAPWAATLEGENRRSTLAIYDQGAMALQTPMWVDSLHLGCAWAVLRQEDRVLRAGLALAMDDARYGAWTGPAPPPFAPPPLEGRRQRGPALTLEYQRDAYRSFRDIQGMDTSEDYNLAWGGTLELGNYSRRLGSNRPGPYWKLQVAKGWTPSPGNLTLFKGKLAGRGRAAASETFQLDASAATYFQVSPRYELAGYLAVKMIDRPDPEHLFYVGAAEGLRGYRNFLHPGDRQAVASVEHRFFTEQRWWGIFRLGYMVFMDAGAVRRIDGRGWTPAYPDLGLGLRLGDLKSSIAKVLTLTVSAPVRRQPGQAQWQWGIENAVRF